MTRVLVVDDAETDRFAIGRLLASEKTCQVDFAEDGKSAIQYMQGTTPDLVLADLVMPGLSGLDLLAEIRSTHPLVPLILMTAHGSEEIVLLALQDGAASYISKDRLDRDLIDTIQRVLAASRDEHVHAHLMDSLTEWSESYVLRNDLGTIAQLLSHLRQGLTTMDCCNENDRVRILLGLHEALLNAFYHGNLELNLDLRDKSDDYAEVAEVRCRKSPYCERKIYVTANLLRDEAVFVIRDDGLGFDSGRLPDPTRLGNMDEPTGRGVVLMRTFFDEVSYNEQGNEVTLIHRRRPSDLPG